RILYQVRRGNSGSEERKKGKRERGNGEMGSDPSRATGTIVSFPARFVRGVRPHFPVPPVPFFPFSVPLTTLMAHELADLAGSRSQTHRRPKRNNRVLAGTSDRSNRCS